MAKPVYEFPKLKDYETSCFGNMCLFNLCPPKCEEGCCYKLCFCVYCDDPSKECCMDAKKYRENGCCGAIGKPCTSTPERGCVCCCVSCHELRWSFCVFGCCCKHLCVTDLLAPCCGSFNGDPTKLEERLLKELGKAGASAAPTLATQGPAAPHGAPAIEEMVR